MSEENDVLIKLCDSVIETAVSLREIVQEAQSPMTFVQQSLRLSALAAVFVSASSAIMDTAMEEVRIAFENAEDSLMSGIMEYLNKEPKND